MSDANDLASRDENDSNDDTWSLVDFVIAIHEGELVSDALWARGVVAIEERNDSDGFVTLRTSMGDDPANLIAEITQLFPHASSTVVRIPRSVADTWRKFATPTFITESIAIVPAWLTPPDDIQPLFIEPLDTFGLGNHPTTVLALRLALRNIEPNSRVFDLGSGSGVLAVGLSKFQQCVVATFDIAESAHEALKLNARLNDVGTVTWSEELGENDFDCVVANILAPVLIAESSKMINATSCDGLIILSGMRDEQVDGVATHFANMKIIDRESLEGWTAIVLQKNE